MEKNKYWVWLSLIKDLGSRKKQKLLEIYKTPENIYKLNKKELISVKGIGEKTAIKIDDYRQKTPFQTIEDLMNIQGIGEKTYLRLREYLCL